MEQQVIWESDQSNKPEFRLYYDTQGNVICYTCDKLKGNFLKIDALTFAESRHDVKVVDGRLTKSNPGSIVSKLIRAETGTNCAEEDVSIIVDNTDYSGKKISWGLKTNEL